MQFAGSIMTPMEAESIVRQLRSFPINEVGTVGWKQQRESLERLNMCTHSNAVQKSDDYVKSFLVEHDRLGEVLHELLVMEVWRQRVLPLVLPAVMDNPSASYMYCYYEGILVNFLECICFYEEVVVGFGDDIIELIDYCWRQVYRLFSEKDVNRVVPKPTAESIKREAPVDHLQSQLQQLLFTRAMGCLSILWFIVDRLEQLPMAASNAILQKNDLPVGLSEILLLQPWLRRSEAETQKFFNGEFVAITGDDVLRVCTPEAHTWFCMHKLLCDPDCRRRYPYTKHSKEIILRVKRFLNDTLVDQIPALSSVQRAMEELTFMEPPSGTEEKFRSTLIIEQVPRLMSSIDVQSTNWNSVAKTMEQILRDPSNRVKDAMRLASIFDMMLGEGSNS